MPSNFWDDISIPYWSMPENTGHPTQKPEKLLAKVILASTNPARALGVDGHYGSLACGHTASLVLLDKTTLAVKHVVLRGKLLV